MADQPSGIDVMRRRIERASRQAPPSRRPAGEAAPGAVAAAAPVPEPAAAVEPAAAPAAPAAPARPARRSRGVGGTKATGPRLAPDLPPVNLAIRVRKPLDDALADTIHSLRGQGVRTSKVELIEMLLWESAGADTDVVRERLRVFREHAPRGSSARLEG